jgi:hypothetical protein
VPGVALIVGFIFTLRAWLVTISQRYWVDRIEFESWWLVKALRSDLYPNGYCNATSKDLEKSYEDWQLRYTDANPNEDVGYLALVPVRAGEAFVESNVNPERIYGL